MVDVLARHLARLGAELERLLADGAVGLRRDVARDDLDRRHRFDRALGRRRMIASADAVDFDLRQLIKEAIEAGSHQELGHVGRQRPETGSSSVVIEQLEGGPLPAGICSAAVGRSSENNHWIERRAIAAAASATAEDRVRIPIGILSISDHVHGGGRRESTARGGSGRVFDLLDEASSTIGADDSVGRQNPNQTVAAVAPVGRHVSID